MHDLIIASTAQPSIFEALGLNWKLLVEQSIAFLILVWILGKFVYPVMIKAIDTRREQIEAGMKEAQASQEALEKAEQKVADMIAEARKDADDLLSRSHQEAGVLIADAESKAKERAEQIVTDARAQLETDVSKARRALKAETVQLVAAATEHIVHEKIDGKKDANLIEHALQAKEQA
jgi:F-type H+-transporting ATPase subunit b